MAEHQSRGRKAGRPRKVRLRPLAHTQRAVSALEAMDREGGNIRELVHQRKVRCYEVTSTVLGTPRPPCGCSPRSAGTVDDTSGAFLPRL